MHIIYGSVTNSSYSGVFNGVFVRRGMFIFEESGGQGQDTRKESEGTSDYVETRNLVYLAQGQKCPGAGFVN